MRKILMIPALTLLVACGNGQSPVKIINLPSGKPVKVLSVGKIAFSNDVPALILSYQTDLNATDLPAMEKEIDEIWNTFRVDVERAKLTSAIIRANNMQKGFIISTGESHAVVYRKGQDGKWSRQK